MNPYFNNDSIGFVEVAHPVVYPSPISQIKGVYADPYTFLKVVYKYLGFVF